MSFCPFGLCTYVHTYLYVYLCSFRFCQVSVDPVAAVDARRRRSIVAHVLYPGFIRASGYSSCHYVLISTSINIHEGVYARKCMEFSMEKPEPEPEPRHYYQSVDFELVNYAIHTQLPINRGCVKRVIPESDPANALLKVSINPPTRIKRITGIW